MTAADAITALIHAYAERLDGGDVDGVAALFADATYGRAGGWRFRARLIRVDLVGDLREHLHRAAGAAG